jgi:hypothetical protein
MSAPAANPQHFVKDALTLSVFLWLSCVVPAAAFVLVPRRPLSMFPTRD